MSARSAYVDVSRKGVADAARWLLYEFNANDYITLLSDSTPDSEQSKAMKLGKKFNNSAKRKRTQDEFEIRLPRDLAEWFGYFCCRPGSSLMPFRAGWEVSRACMKASRTRRGSRRLEDKALADRASNAVPREERHRKRLQARIRANKQFDEMLRRNGGSLWGPI